MTLTLTISWPRLIALCLGLALFAWQYNRWVERLERHGHDRGYMSFIVSLGVAVTGLAFTLATHWLLGLVLAACFFASGVPMILGSVSRYVQARARDESEIVRTVLRHLRREGGI